MTLLQSTALVLATIHLLLFAYFSAQLDERMGRVSLIHATLSVTLLAAVALAEFVLHAVV